jgi:hypothetical protein
MGQCLKNFPGWGAGGLVTALVGWLPGAGLALRIRNKYNAITYEAGQDTFC